MTPLLISDIVKQLRVYMPWHTDIFTNFLTIDYFTGPGPLFDAPDSVRVPFASPHGLSVGDVVIVKSMAMHTPISGASRDDDHGIIEISADPTDLTYRSGDDTTIEIGGFDSAGWDGEKQLAGIYKTPTATVIRFLPRPETTPKLPIVGYAYLKENRPTFKGMWIVTDTPTSLEATIRREGMPTVNVSTAVTGLQICSVSNVVAAPDIHRAIAMYTSVSQTDKSWLYVIPTGRRTSNDRLARTDAIAEFGSGDINRLYTLMSFAVVAIMDTSGNIAAGAAMDLLQGDVYSALNKSIFGFAKPSCGTDFGIVPASDAIERYDTSYIVHSYHFEAAQTIDFTDGFSDPQDFAADQIEYIQHPGCIDNPETLKTTINTR